MSKTRTLFQYDPEKLDPELRKDIEEMEEHKLYFIINHAGGVRHSVRHRSSHPERATHIPVPEALTVEQEMFMMQRYSIEQLKAKGILENPVDEDGVPTDEYWVWFKRWHYHVESLPKEEWEAFDKAMEAGEDVSRWYPKEEK